MPGTWSVDLASRRRDSGRKPQPSAQLAAPFDQDRGHKTMNTVRPMLPTLTVNRQFMMDFIAKEPPCLALGLVEVEGSQCAMITVRLNEALPREVSAAGFAFGHALYGGGSWEVVHFGFEFYGFATWHVLINPSDPVARLVLRTMIRTGDYFFLRTQLGPQHDGLPVGRRAE